MVHFNLWSRRPNCYHFYKLYTTIYLSASKVRIVHITSQNAQVE